MQPESRLPNFIFCLLLIFFSGILNPIVSSAMVGKRLTLVVEHAIKATWNLDSESRKTMPSL
jgi:hypothetical protein